MNTASTSATRTGAAVATRPATSAASREVTLIAALLGGVVLAGSALQLFIAPGPTALVASAGIAGAALFALGFVLPSKLRQTLVSFRFTSTLLVALAAAAILGTLVLQGKPEALYRQRYGALGDLILALRLDDIFHSIWFGGLLALFGAALLSSAIQRWPVKLKSAGFFTCHLGLITCLAGAALSTTMSVRGRVDLHAGGEHADAVAVTRSGMPTGQVVPLGFDLRLDRFELVRYNAEYRIAFYDKVKRKVDGRVEEAWAVKASFDPDLGKHRLPGGDSFRVKAFYPDFVVKPGAGYGTASQELRNPAVLLELNEAGRTQQALLVARQGGAVRLARGGAMAFEHREDEVKAFNSSVTAIAGATAQKALVSVNDPFTFGGWTFYQVNYDPRDPTYSGLEAVRDPGVPWVFVGFALISAGVFYMFYVETRLKRRREA